MKVNVKTSTNNYDVIIGSNLLGKIDEYICLDKKTLIVTDSGVPSIYSEVIAKQCENPFIFTFKCGEQSKNINTYQEIIGFMIRNNFTRNDKIVAVGGGVVGDLAGFVAATYMRGIKFYNVPTTLLSQIDSSIGGKTAIDFNGIKNIIGSFYPPSLVLIDVETLKTLPQRQVNAGLVEAIKMAATFDKNLFKLIKESKDLASDLQQIIYQSLMIKKIVVEKDEKESSLRRVLNFGHTIGHAIEGVNNLELLHGECVGLGMTYMSSPSVKKEIVEVLEKYDLPVSIDIDGNKLVEFIKHDKKADGEKISIIKCEEIGTYKEEKIEISELLKCI